MRKAFSSSRLIGAAAALFVLVGAGCTAPAPLENTNGGQTACTMEARQCPDGSYVGRSGPNCEFAPCPDGTRIDVDIDAGAQTE